MKTKQSGTRQLILIAAIFSISFTVLSQEQIPEKWQPGMTLTMSYGGGMRYYSYKMQISDTGSFFIENVEGKVTYYRLQITGNDLDSLIRFLNQKKFGSMKSEGTGPAHDKGTEVITLHWKDGVKMVMESYTQDVMEKYQASYQALHAYLYTLRESKKKKVNPIPGQDPPQ